MRLTHFFIDRPRFATVLSAFVTLLGFGALAILPIAQYPEVVPPTVQITTSFPGASAETVARTVATPLEQSINRRWRSNDNRHVPHRHRPQRRANADAKSGRGRAVTPARGRAAPGCAGSQVDTQHSVGHSPLLA